VTTANGRKEQVVVLAGGFATRLGPLAREVPKVLQPVGDEIFLDAMLTPVRASGFRRFHFCLGHLADAVRCHLQRWEGELEITSSVERTPRGTAAALLDSLGHLDDLFLLLLGDTYLDIDYARVVDLMPCDVPALMVATSAPCGVTPNVLLSGGRVVRYDKDGVPGGLTDTGVAVLRRSALRPLPAGAGPVDLGDVFRRLIDRGELAGTEIAERFYDIGTPTRHGDFVAHRHRAREQRHKEGQR
jgi:NDP-sugar pyrophosphorylase family protein